MPHLIVASLAPIINCIKHLSPKVSGICFFNISYLFYPPIYAMKLRVKLRNWLWDKVRRPKIELAYHPSEIMKRINETENWEEW